MNRRELRCELEDFLVHEAWLLDSDLLEGWLELFADDVRYWAPVRMNLDKKRENFSQPLLTAHFDDNKMGLDLRVKRVRTGLARTEEPPSRLRHFVSNVRIIEIDGSDRVRVGSNFIVFKSRAISEETWFVGTREDRCRRKVDGWLIEERMIVLDHNAVPTITVLF